MGSASGNISQASSPAHAVQCQIIAGMHEAAYCKSGTNTEDLWVKEQQSL